MVVISKNILIYLNKIYSNKYIFKIYNYYRHSNFRVGLMYLRYGEFDIIPYLIHVKKNLVFVPVPKVATTSITNIIHKKGNFDSYFLKKVSPSLNAYVFSIIRNPFSRTVSCYKCCVLHPTNTFGLKYYENSYKKNKISFENYVKKISKINDDFSDSHFKSQYAILNKKYNKLKVDNVLKIENIKKDFEPLRKRFKLEKIPITNVTKKKGENWEDYYTLELAELIYNRYKKDFEMWYPNEYKKLQTYLKRKDN